LYVERTMYVPYAAANPTSARSMGRERETADEGVEVVAMLAAELLGVLVLSGRKM
jgi:hypothetical protein